MGLRIGGDQQVGVGGDKAFHDVAFRGFGCGDQLADGYGRGETFSPDSVGPLETLEQGPKGGADFRRLHLARRDFRCHVLAQLEEPAFERLPLHDLEVILDVRRGWHVVEQLADILPAADRREIALALELVGERYGINDRAGAVQSQHRPEDPAVGFSVEHRLVDEFHGAHDRIGGEEHGTERRALGVLRVRGTDARHHAHVPTGSWGFAGARPPAVTSRRSASTSAASTYQRAPRFWPRSTPVSTSAHVCAHVFPRSWAASASETSRSAMNPPSGVECEPRIDSRGYSDSFICAEPMITEKHPLGE